MIYFEIGGERISLAFIASGVGTLAMGIIGLALNLAWPELPWHRYVAPLLFTFLIFYSLSIVLPGVHAIWLFNAETRARAAALGAGQGMTEVAALVQPLPLYERRVPVHSGQGTHEITLESTASGYEVAWREACVDLLVWAHHKNSLKSEGLVGPAVASPEDWVKITNVLRDGGYILKANGQVTLLAPPYSYVTAIADIQRGHPLPHPNRLPPAVRKPY